MTSKSSLRLDEIIDDFYEDVYSHRRRRVTNSGDRKRVKKEAKTAILKLFESKNDPKVAQAGDINPKSSGAINHSTLSNIIPRELLCQLCNQEYSVWFAPNPIWNQVMRYPDGREASEKYHFVCPNCFIKIAEKRGLKTTGWMLTTSETIKDYSQALRLEIEE